MPRRAPVGVRLAHWVLRNVVFDVPTARSPGIVFEAAGRDPAASGLNYTSRLLPRKFYSFRESDNPHHVTFVSAEHSRSDVASGSYVVLNSRLTFTDASELIAPRQEWHKHVHISQPATDFEATVWYDFQMRPKKTEE